MYWEALWKIPIYYSHVYNKKYLVDTIAKQSIPKHRYHSKTQLCIISHIKLFLSSFSTWQKFSPNSASCSLNTATNSFDCQMPQWGFIEQHGKFCTLLTSEKQPLYTAPVGVFPLSCSIKNLAVPVCFNGYICSFLAYKFQCHPNVEFRCKLHFKVIVHDKFMQFNSRFLSL